MARLRASARFAGVFSLDSSFEGSPARAASAGFAGGGRYTVDGGTKAQRTQVRLALEASAFDWSIVPAQVRIRIASGVTARSQPAEIWLDGRLLSSGPFAWAVVQDEYAHQIDYFLLDGEARAILNEALGGRVWCRTQVANLPHSAYGCERFASTVVWAYWQDAQNAYRPRAPGDEAAAMAPDRFRELLERLLGLAPATRALLLHPDGERRQRSIPRPRCRQRRV